MLIGEIIKKTGVTKDTLRYYEKINLLKDITFSVGENGYRNYNEKAIETLNFIFLAKEYGCTLKEINEMIEIHLEKGLNKNLLNPLIISKLSNIKQSIKNLKTQKNKLESLLQSYKGCC